MDLETGALVAVTLQDADQGGMPVKTCTVESKSSKSEETAHPSTNRGLMADFSVILLWRTGFHLLMQDRSIHSPHNILG